MFSVKLSRAERSPPQKNEYKISVMDFWIHASLNNLRQESLELFYILYIKVSKSTLKNFKGENEKKKNVKVKKGTAKRCPASLTNPEG